MPSTWTILWSPKEITNAHRDGVLEVLGSNHFGRRPVQKGDTIWVLYSPSRGKLHAIGALQVAPVMRRGEAVKRFGRDLFDREWFVRPLDGKAVPVREVDVTVAARQLTFEGAKRGAGRLRFGAGAPALGHQLRAMRLLTPRSAAQLAKFYRRGEPVDDAARKVFRAAAAQLSAGDIKREVLVRKEQAALRKILFRDETHATCALCQDEFPVGLLVAAHLKRRAECTREEREDPANIAPMCALGCDALYERGVVRVINGKLTRMPGQQVSGRLAKLLRTLDGRDLGPLWRRAKQYLRWHAESF